MPKLLALSVRLDIDHGYCSTAHIIAVPVLVDTDVHNKPGNGCADGEITYGSSYTEDEAWMQDFQCRCQANTEARADGRREFYAWECQYREKFSVELRDAQRMVKVLTKIEKSLEKQAEADGRATCFAEYCFRVAKSLGCKFIVFKNNTERFNGSGYAYYSVKMGGDALDRLRYLESEFVTEKVGELVSA